MKLILLLRRSSDPSARCLDKHFDDPSILATVDFKRGKHTTNVLALFSIEAATAYVVYFCNFIVRVHSIEF